MRLCLFLLLVLIPGDDDDDDNDDDDDDEAVLNLWLLLSRRSSLSDYEKGNKKGEKVMLLRDEAKKSVGQK